ncbi:MAG: RND family efflux transporter MFP subunit [Kiritimatiellia bacterium]|jgi:RND family efflux transporter MFP subunit
MKKCHILACMLLPASLYGAAISAPGITEPIIDATLSSSVPGMIKTLHVKEGERVKKGQVILTLDQALETLEVARRKLAWESKVEVEAAEARAALLLQDYEGTKKLFETTQSISKEDLDKKDLEYRLSVAEWQRLEIVEQREALEYQIAEQQLLRKLVKAPGDGIITTILLEEGENCQERQPLARFVDISQGHFISNIDASLVGKIKTGQAVTVSVPIGTKMITLPATLSYIAPVVDPASGLLEIKALFMNPQENIRPGVAGTLNLEVE